MLQVMENMLFKMSLNGLIIFPVQEENVSHPTARRSIQTVSGYLSVKSDRFPHTKFRSVFRRTPVLPSVSIHLEINK